MVAHARQGRLVILSAPSGGGKTSAIRRLRARHADLLHSISWTTRPVRPGKVDDAYYENVDRRTFLAAAERGTFVEWTEVHGHLYGTPRGPLDEALARGHDVLLDLDVVGGLKLKQAYGRHAVLIFLMPPSLEELRRRLSARATDSAAVQDLRLVNAAAELDYKDRYDHRVVNDDLARACAEVETILGRRPPDLAPRALPQESLPCE